MDRSLRSWSFLLLTPESVTRVYFDTDSLSKISVTFFLLAITNKEKLNCGIDTWRLAKRKRRSRGSEADLSLPPRARWNAKRGENRIIDWQLVGTLEQVHGVLRVGCRLIAVLLRGSRVLCWPSEVLSIVVDRRVSPSIHGIRNERPGDNSEIRNLNWPFRLQRPAVPSKLNAVLLMKRAHAVG